MSVVPVNDIQFEMPANVMAALKRSWWRVPAQAEK
jgi:hypothetical protein